MWCKKWSPTKTGFLMMLIQLNHLELKLVCLYCCYSSANITSTSILSLLLKPSELTHFWWWGIHLRVTIIFCMSLYVYFLLCIDANVFIKPSWLYISFKKVTVLCPHRFLELQFPQRSKALRTGAFVVPFMFDTVPLFYRVSVCTGIYVIKTICTRGACFSDWIWDLYFLHQPMNLVKAVGFIGSVFVLLLRKSTELVLIPLAL